MNRNTFIIFVHTGHTQIVNCVVYLALGLYLALPIKHHFTRQVF